jgi:hypothetical protein
MKEIYLVVSIFPYEGQNIEYITKSKKDLKKYLQIAKSASLFLYHYLSVLVIDSSSLPLSADNLNFQDTSNYDT